MVNHGRNHTSDDPTIDMATHTSNQLAELISRKHQVLGQLRRVGLEQIELVEQGEVPALLKLLAAKQHLISNLQAVETELVPFRDQDPENRTWSSPAARDECALQAEQCNELLNEVVYLEKQSEDKMIARRNEVADQLQQVYSASQARGAYAANQTSAPVRAPHFAMESEVPTGGLDLVSGE